MSSIQLLNWNSVEIMHGTLEARLTFPFSVFSKFSEFLQTKWNFFTSPKLLFIFFLVLTKNWNAKSHFFLSLSPFVYPQGINVSKWLLLMHFAQLTLDFLSTSWGCQQKFSICIQKNAWVQFSTKTRWEYFPRLNSKTELKIVCKSAQFKIWVNYFHAEQSTWSKLFFLDCVRKTWEVSVTMKMPSQRGTILVSSVLNEVSLSNSSLLE